MTKKMKYVRESLNEELAKYPIATLDWDDIKPPMADMLVNLPEDTATDMGVWNEDRFDSWYLKFIKHYGNEGYLVKKSGRSYDVIHNQQYDTEKKMRYAAMDDFRDTRKYQGD